MTNLKALVFGSTGQVGWELCRHLAGAVQIAALEYPAVDFRSPDSIREAVREARPTLIVNAAAYTAVD